jgi:hypothetical protein
MERDPANRYASAREMKAELDDYEKVELVGRYQKLQSPQLWKSRFRNLPLILVLALGWVISFILLILYFKHHGK